MLKGKIIFEKLVRDRVFQKLENDGFTVHYKVLSHDQKKNALQMKLIEEIDELLKAQSKGEVLEELCDLYDYLRQFLINMTCKTCCIYRKIFP